MTYLSKVGWGNGEIQNLLTQMAHIGRNFPLIWWVLSVALKKRCCLFFAYLCQCTLICLTPLPRYLWHFAQLKCLQQFTWPTLIRDFVQTRSLLYKSVAVLLISTSYCKSRWMRPSRAAVNSWEGQMLKKKKDLSDTSMLLFVDAFPRIHNIMSGVNIFKKEAWYRHGKRIHVYVRVPSLKPT